MRPALALAAPLVCACAVAPLAPLRPAPDWTKGTPIVVAGPQGIDQFNAANTNPDDKEKIKAAVEEDLGSLGFKLLLKPQDEGELVFDIGLITPNEATATVSREGVQIDRFRIDPSGMYCWSSFAGSDLPKIFRCVARALAEMAAGSAQVAEAARKPPSRRAVTPAAAPAQPGALRGKLAVLELRNLAAKDLTRDNAQYFTDVVRQAALKTQPQLQVMTRENLLVLLEATGKRIEECEGECEVDTGRRIGADLIVSGEIQKLGSLFKLSLRMHDTHEGRLIASAIASGKTVEELDAAAQKAAYELLPAR